eukprot:6235970-Pyramimonas_sp.AAC.1
MPALPGSPTDASRRSSPHELHWRPAAIFGAAKCEPRSWNVSSGRRWAMNASATQMHMRGWP